MRRTTLAAVAIVGLAGCASPGMPPGGPVDTEAPKIVKIAPDSGNTGVTPREVIFRFDEVVNERPSGAQSLEALVLVSPRDGEPRVDWHRDEISVRPRRGWRPNTAYTITLLPGLSDLRGNVRNTPVVTMFATGETLPASRITGTFFNWPEGRAIARGLIEARPRTDTSLAYVTTTDSIGDFVMSNLPTGPYLVRGISDDNNNRSLDPRELWDSATIDLADSANVRLYGFVHDSTGSRLQGVALRDSVTIELVFDNPLSLSPPLGAANIRVRASDSTDVPIVSVSPPPADTTAAGRRIQRPSPPRTIIVRVGRPLRPGTQYRVSVTDARNLTGVARNSDRVLVVPVPSTTPPPVAPPAAPPPSPIRR
ncbi:MAG: Ig-like domain-containing protein [Gemmatimonadales bacterium]